MKRVYFIFFACVYNPVQLICFNFFSFHFRLKRISIMGLCVSFCPLYILLCELFFLRANCMFCVLCVCLFVLKTSASKLSL